MNPVAAYVISSPVFLFQTNVLIIISIFYYEVTRQMSCLKIYVSTSYIIAKGKKTASVLFCFFIVFF